MVGVMQVRPFRAPRPVVREPRPPARCRPHRMPTETESSASCVVCTFEIGMVDRVSELRCGHVFHASCVDPWLDMHHTCPTCRNLEDPEGGTTP